MLRRAGHTEATVDLARLAGLPRPASCVEILDGIGVASRERLHAIAREFRLPILSIEMLIAYRRRREKLVTRLAEAELPTRYGEGRIIIYGVKHEPGNEPVAVVMGDLQAQSRRRSCGCTRRASPATCSTRSAATAATSSAWRWR